MKVDDEGKMKKAIERFPNYLEDNPHDYINGYTSTESIKWIRPRYTKVPDEGVFEEKVHHEQMGDETFNLISEKNRHLISNIFVKTGIEFSYTIVKLEDIVE